MSHGMTVRELRKALKAHDQDAAVCLSGTYERWMLKSVEFPDEAAGWYVVGSGCAAVCLYAGDEVAVDAGPVPPETVTVEIPRETAEWIDEQSREPHSFIGSGLPFHIVEACRKALQDGEQ